LADHSGVETPDVISIPTPAGVAAAGQSGSPLFADMAPVSTVVAAGADEARTMEDFSEEEKSA
jgi:hypothetical protein